LCAQFARHAQVIIGIQFSAENSDRGVV